MKKSILFLLCICIISGCMWGCKPNENESVTVCVDSAFEHGAQEIIEFLGDTGNENEYILEVIPATGDERESAIQRIRTEIMAGQGPDVFIMSTYHPVAFDEDVKVMLFEDPTKAMASGLFYDVTEMAEGSEIIDLENCLGKVMDAGVYKDQRYILPMMYGYSGAVVDTEILKSSTAVYTTIDDLLSCGEEALFNKISIGMSEQICNSFSEIVNYETGEVYLTADDLEKEINNFEQIFQLFEESLDAVDSIDSYYSAVGSLGVRDFMYSNTDCTVIPLPNDKGGVTAAVTVYGAVGANTNNPEAAFEFIEAYFHDEFMDLTTGIRIDESTKYGGESIYGGFTTDYSFPVKPNVNETAFLLATPATLASHEAVVKRINCVKIYSVIDMEIISAAHDPLNRENSPMKSVSPETVVRTIKQHINE